MTFSDKTPAEDDVADIAWMRRLAEEGSAAPFTGGSILLAAGLIYGLASLAHWAMATGIVEVDPEALSFLWLGATLLFLTLLVVARVAQKKATSVVTSANRAFGAAWSGVGWGIFAMITSLAVIAWRLGTEGSLVVAVIPSAVLVFYGIGWAVSAAMSRSRFLSILAAGSLIAAPLLAALTGRPEQYLAYGVALLLLMAAPGWILMRQASRA